MASGCGGEDASGTLSGTQGTAPPPPTAETSTTPDLQEPTTTTTAPSSTATATTPPATTATTPPASGTTSPEEQQGGAGDEEAIRQPLALTIGLGGTISPARVELSAFLPVGVTLTNEDDAAHTVKLLLGGKAVGPGSGLELAAGASRTLTLPGVPPGRSTVEVDDGAGRTVVQVSNDAAGP